MSPIVLQGHPSNFKVTRDQKLPILTRIWCLWSVIPVWIARWLWNEAQILVPYGFSRSSVKCQSHTGQFQFTWWLWNNAQGLLWPKSCTLLFMVIHLTTRSYGLKNEWFESNLKITSQVAEIKSLRFVLLLTWFKWDHDKVCVITPMVLCRIWLLTHAQTLFE